MDILSTLEYTTLDETVRLQNDLGAAHKLIGNALPISAIVC